MSTTHTKSKSTTNPKPQKLQDYDLDDLRLTVFIETEDEDRRKALVESAIYDEASVWHLSDEEVFESYVQLEVDKIERRWEGYFENTLGRDIAELYTEEELDKLTGYFMKVPYLFKNSLMSQHPEMSKRLRHLARCKPESDPYLTLDSVGFSRLFEDCYKDSILYCPEKKSWFIYNSKIWEADKEGLGVFNRLADFIEYVKNYLNNDLDDPPKEFRKFVYSLGSRRIRENIIKDAKDKLMVSSSLMDSNPFLLNFKNGTLNLETYELQLHNYRDYITMVCNTEWVKFKDIPHRWTQFINEICNNDQAKVDYLQRCLGASIRGTQKEECMYLLHGKTTRNGKSTLLNAIHHVLGGYASVAPVALITSSAKYRNAEQASPTLHSLKGKRFVTMSESNKYGKLDEETLKQLTGGEEIVARGLYEQSSSFLPQFTLWLSCNDLPSVQDKSLFTSDRLRVIEFNRHFSHQDRDLGLKDLFKTEDFKIGIALWLVEGHKKYQEQGAFIPDWCKPIIEAYEQDNDLCYQFLNEYCERSNKSTPAKSLYQYYKIWCRSNNYWCCPYKSFIKDVEGHPEWYEKKFVSMGIAKFKGISLKSSVGDD